MKNKKGLLWFEKTEETHSAIPYFLTFWCLKVFPRFFINGLAWVIAFFYFIFCRRARVESIRYQKNLKEFYSTKDVDSKIKIRPLRQLVNFSITLVEKLDCWTNPKPPVTFEDLHFNDDDAVELIERLNNKKGAFVFISHLGNFEVLRALANSHKMGVNTEVPFAVISDVDVSSNFSKAMKKISPVFFSNTINNESINIATIEKLMDIISKGGLVVCAGDRLSKNAAGRIVTENFLGRAAPFSYGAFLLPLLLEVPVYFIFGFKKKNLFFSREFEIHIRKAKAEIFGSRKERELRIQNLCAEYAKTLEDFCKTYPYQWYNFFDFWAFPESQENYEPKQ